jgi:hypothetical protein
VLKHGEFVVPEVALDDKGPSPENREAMSGVLERFGRRKRASDQPSALGNVAAVYPDAVQFMEASGSAQMRGLGLMAVLAYAGIVSFVVPLMILKYIEYVKDGMFGVSDALFAAFGFFFLFVVARPWIVAAWRLDAFAADDQPTIFDRKHRRVYRLFTPFDDSHKTWAKRFQPIELQAVEYDWDCITAEHRAEMVTTGKTVTRIHRLTMVVRDYPQPGEKYGRLLEEFNVGNSLALGPNTVPMLWEQIRRFMEEGGSGVPHGEPMQVFERPTNLWQSMGVVGPFGPRFAWWWRTNKLPTLFALVSLPFSLPFTLLWAVCNWISHMTMRKTVWPAEIHERIGQPIRMA